MQNNNIIEGNILIAEFMEFYNVLSNTSSVYYNLKKQTHWFRFPVYLHYKKDLWDTEDPVVQEGNGELMKFHVSWDWLIPVVKKIEKLCEEDIHLYFEYIYPNNGEDKKEDFLTFRITEGIERLWLMVVEFIEWYNERLKNEKK